MTPAPSPLPGVDRDAPTSHTGPSGNPAGAKEIVQMTKPLDHMPRYAQHSIFKMTVGRDGRIKRQDLPHVNRLSDHYKALASLHADAHEREELKQVNAGIGDCTAGYTLREIVQMVNFFAGYEVIPLSVLDNLDESIHFGYGPVKGLPALINGSKEILTELFGVEVRDFLTITHGGRAAVNIALHACLVAMHTILAEKCIEAAAIIYPKREQKDALHRLTKVVEQYTGNHGLSVTCATELMKLWEQEAGTDMVLETIVQYVRVQASGPVPTWGTYPNICQRALGDESWISIETTDGLLNAEDLDAACTKNPRIRFVVFPNPGNPTGRQYGSDRMAALCRIIAKHQLFAYEDAMYAMFAWRRQHRSLFRAAAALAKAGASEVGEWVAAHTFCLTGFMKAGGSGTRVNHMIIPNDNLRALYTACQGDMYGPPCAVSQVLQLMFIRNGGPDRVWAEMLERRNVLDTTLGTMIEPLARAGIILTWTPMEGGFYTLARFQGVKGLSWVTRNDEEVTIETGEQFGDLLSEFAAFTGSPDLAACIEDCEAMRIAYGTLEIEKMPFLAQIVTLLIKIAQENGRNIQPAPNNGVDELIVPAVPAAG